LSHLKVAGYFKLISSKKQTNPVLKDDLRLYGDFTAAGCPGGGRATALSLCMQAVGGA